MKSKEELDRMRADRRGNRENEKSGGNEAIGDGPIIGPSQVKNPASNADPTLSPFHEIVRLIEYGAEAMHILDLVEDGLQWGRPAYRQIKYALPLGGIEWGIDAGLQLYDDQNLSLSPNERLVRAAVRGFESYTIDGASVVVGTATAGAIQASFPEAPGVAAGAGYGIGSYSTSKMLDNAATRPLMNDLTPSSPSTILTRINSFIEETDIRILVYVPPVIGFVGFLTVMFVINLVTDGQPYPPIRDKVLGIASFFPCFSGYSEIYKREMPRPLGGIYKGSWAIVSGTVTIIVFGSFGVMLLIYGINAVLR